MTTHRHRMVCAASGTRGVASNSGDESQTTLAPLPIGPSTGKLTIDTVAPMGSEHHRWSGLLTIDGPAGAGKSTSAHAVAAIIGGAVLDVGLLYREIATRVLTLSRDEVDWKVALTTSIEGPMPLVTERPEHRSEAIEALVAHVAAEPAVRDVVTVWQREWSSRQDAAIVVGRVGGLHVFPEADLKVYLTADEQVRDLRRGLSKGAVENRDNADASRRSEPMACSPDAVVIDTTSLLPNDMVAQLCRLLLIASGGE